MPVGFLCSVPIVLQDTAGVATIEEYAAPVIQDSDVPALLGLKALQKRRSILDLTKKQIHFCGPGEVQITLPPGSRTIDLEAAPSGHLLLPVSDFGLNPQKSQNISLLAADAAEK